MLLSCGYATAQDRPREAREPTQGLARPVDNAMRDIRVQVVPVISATIGAPMAGRLNDFPLRDGDRFQKGQLIAKFACGEREGSLAHARALLDAKRRIFSNKQQLRSLGTSTGLEYDVAAAEMNEAAADVATNTAMVEHCTVTAPFAGRVAAVMGHPYQFMGLGSPMLDILSDRELELEMIGPSRWLAWLKPGAKFDVVIDETGKTYGAEVTRLSGRVDPISRSIKVYGRLPIAPDDLLSGMSGRALLAPPAGER